MKFTTHEDIEAPLEAVYKAFTDSDGWERAVLRRGAEVSRTDKLTAFGIGMGWLVGFVWRGRPRKLTIRVDQVEAPQQVGLTVVGSSIDAKVNFDFVPLSAKRTRVAASADVKPRNLAARVFLQSLKLAKGKADARFRTRFAALCAEVEARLSPDAHLRRL